MANVPTLRMAGVDPAVWSYLIVPGTHKVGRAGECDIRLPDPTVSRVHAELVCAGDRLSIRDLHSQNGTFVNGAAVGCEAPLAPGDILQLGRVTLQVVPTRADVGEHSTLPLDQPRREARERHCASEPLGWAELGLTTAQTRVVDLLLSGLAEKEIAARLYLSSHTVHTHSKKIYELLGVHSRRELMAKLLLSGDNPRRADREG
jgi:DNA-binding CsgD family transcriptional regulator